MLSTHVPPFNNHLIGERGANLLRLAGHDFSTVGDQQLVGTEDENLFAVCATESRALITLDHDFGHVLRFPPSKSAGIEIGRHPARAADH
jgi:predicted nuclease of predicted toxin-antitoxin system